MTLKLGVAHSAGKYSYPSSTNQFLDGVNAIANVGFPVLKIYCTSNYLADYPLQSAWSSTPTSLVTLAQTTQFVSALSLPSLSTVIMTCFTFVNGITNWWRVDPSKTRLDAEYTEVKALASYLLTTYSGSGKTFVLQNWEGDWAFMDAFVVDTYVDRQMVDRYSAFLGVRQKAVEDARREAAFTNVRVLNCYEANRVLDSKLKPHLRRLLRDMASRVQPDVISWSAYDGTIVDQGGFGTSFETWKAATVPVLTKCLKLISRAFPGVPIQIGEYGFPEGVELPAGRNVGDMIQVVYDVAASLGVTVKIYWQVFDNEETSPSVPRGFYTVKPGGTVSQAGAKLATLL